MSEIMEAHTVGPHPIGGSAFRPGTEPAGWCVAWPCGCTLSPGMARLLAQV